MRSYQELLSNDPAWPALEKGAWESGRVTILPANADAARTCLESLQITTRSPLGALAHETGGLLVDCGWVRLFGSGHVRLRRGLGQWNMELGIPLGDFLLVGDDVVGGAFAINGGALGPAAGSIFYFAPDALTWEDMGVGHSEFMQWIFEGDIGSFYRSMRWPGWEADIGQVGGDQALSLYPPPWTVEGKDLSKVSRRAVSVTEVWTIQQEFARQIAASPPSTSS
ncbi:MAG: DUF2625 family protein [Kofleriaceae bacterium]